MVRLPRLTLVRLSPRLTLGARLLGADLALHVNECRRQGCIRMGLQHGTEGVTDSSVYSDYSVYCGYSGSYL